MEGTDRSVAMDYFRQRGMAQGQGMAPQTPQSTPQVATPGASPQMGGGQPPQGTETTNVLKQVTGEITQDEVVEALIKRLKDLIAKKPQGGTTNATV